MVCHFDGLILFLMYTNAIIVKSHWGCEDFSSVFDNHNYAIKKKISKDTQTKGINGVETLPIVA